MFRMSFSSKPLTLSEIKQVVESLGNLVESTLETHSLALVIGNSGEATFTRSGWKLLSEAGSNSPVAKIIVNCAKNYTTLCGDDCKYLLFVLKEMVRNLHMKVHGNYETYTRVKFIHEISVLKQMLPCIFQSIRNFPTRVTPPNSCLFAKDLHSIVKTFMLPKFSAAVANHLSSLICDFIQSINDESNSLNIILDYVITHFDLFCFKVLASLSESRVIRGFLFHRKCISPNITLENTKFIIIYDMSMKRLSNDMSWKISDEAFVHGLNEYNFYKKVYGYFKDQGIKLIITPCACDKNVKLLCDKNCIILLDRLEREEIEHILCCVKLSPLENFNEALESKHIGELKHLKPFSCNNSRFLHLLCTNSSRLLNTHNILLSTPFDALWKEYYAECLNCLKIVNQWLCSNAATCSFLSQPIIKGCLDKPIHLVNINCICSQSEIIFDKSLKLNEIADSVLESHQDIDITRQVPNSILESYQDIDISPQTTDSGLEPFEDIDIATHVTDSVLEPYQDIDIAPQITNSDLKPLQDIGNAPQITNSFLESHQDIGIALPPVLWEFLLQTSLKNVLMNVSLPCRNVSQILHLTIVKLVCKKIGIQFCKVTDLKDAYHVFFERSKKSNESLLEPIVCKEIMIYNVLDLMLQLLKIDGIITAK